MTRTLLLAGASIKEIFGDGNVTFEMNGEVVEDISRALYVSTGISIKSWYGFLSFSMRAGVSDTVKALRYMYENGTIDSFITEENRMIRVGVY